MRFALTSTLALVALYLSLLGAVTWWVDRTLGGMTASFIGDTARLVGTEIGAAMSGSARDQLLAADPVTHLRLSEMVTNLTQSSDTVAGIAVVDQDGRVVVSDDLDPGRQVASPAVVFQNTRDTVLIPPVTPLGAGTYLVFIPLLRDGDVAGYIRLSLKNQRIIRVYQQRRRELLIGAVTGLVIIAALGGLLHVNLSRRRAALLRALEATARGETLAPASRRDEFSEVIAAAGRLGRELTASRARNEQARRRIDALTDSLEVGVLLLRADRTLEFANATARDLLGWPTPDNGAQHWGDIHRRLDEAWKAAAGSPPLPTRIDLDLPDADRPRALRFEIHRAGDNDQDGYLVLVKDRDLLDAVETDLRLATQMRGLARTYGALAHEIKAPLGAMALNLELLDDSLRNNLAVDVDQRQTEQRYTAVLREELDRLNRSLVSVLSQTTAMATRPERFDLGQMIHDVAALLTPQASQQGVALTVNAPPTPLWTMGHQDRLRQAFLNLLDNGLDAMPGGGQLDVTVQERDGCATVSVQDSGPGIPQELVGKIFNMYYSSKDRGTGIGLHVARTVVEAHGGTIAVESRTGVGTAFRVELPVGVTSA